MKKTINLLFALMLTVALGACAQNWSTSAVNSALDFFGSGTTRVTGSDNYVTKTMKMEDFTRVKLSGSADVEYTQQPGRAGVEIYTSDNIVELLEVKVTDGTLVIGFKKGYNISYKKLRVRVHSAGLSGISLAGSGLIDLGDKLETSGLEVNLAGSGDIKGNDIRCNGDFTVSLAGSGDMNIDKVSCASMSVRLSGSGDVVVGGIEASDVEASIAGSGDVTLAGHSEEATYAVRGSGDIHAAGLQAVRVDASTSGSGNIECRASEHLKTHISGSGGIGYKGSPVVESGNKSRGVYKL